MDIYGGMGTRARNAMIKAGCDADTIEEAREFAAEAIANGSIAEWKGAGSKTIEEIEAFASYEDIEEDPNGNAVEEAINIEDARESLQKTDGRQPGRNCKKCRASHQETGTCRRRPPQIFTSDDGELLNAWPAVDGDDWCSDFLPQEKFFERLKKLFAKKKSKATGEA